MKKSTLNWRYYAMAMMMIASITLVIVAFGESGSVISQIIVFAAGALIFKGLSRCVRRWERRNEIPEYSNLTKQL